MLQGRRKYPGIAVLAMMGQKPVPPVNIPIPTKNRVKWVLHLFHNGTIGFDPQPFLETAHSPGLVLQTMGQAGQCYLISHKTKKKTFFLVRSPVKLANPIRPWTVSTKLVNTESTQKHVSKPVLYSKIVGFRLPGVKVWRGNPRPPFGVVGLGHF